jgi:predicted Zn-dependent peptidase
MKKLILLLMLIVLIPLKGFSNELKNNFSSSIVNIPYSTAAGINILFRNRSLFEKEYKKQGIVDYSSYVLKTVYDEMQDEFDSIGCELQFYDLPFIPFDDYYTRDDMSFIRIKVQNENIGKALVLTRKLIEKAKKVTDAQLQKATSSAMRSNMMRRSSLKDTAYGILKKELFKDDYPSYEFYCKRPTYSPVEVRDFLKNYLSSANTIVSVVGELNTNHINNIVRNTFLSKVKGIKTVPYRKAKLTVPDKKIFTFEKKRKQGYILSLIPLPQLNTKQLANTMLVTSYLSEKLTFQLREREGLAYSMGAYITTIGGNKFFAVSMATSPNKVDYSFEKINKIIKETLKKDIDEEELLKTKNKLIGHRLMRRLPNVNKAFYHSINLNLGQPLEFQQIIDKEISNTTVQSYKDATKFIDTTKEITVLIK